ncbi:MAG TPA: DUF664 domain-containing protein [Nocardioidaceae bacterium]|nr:DUF664 domain-containing protein [Nocardioidaceae bacterium]
MADNDTAWTPPPWDPPLAGTEVEQLIGALDRLRTTFRWKVERRLLCDLIEEYGRHTGHADLLREAVDGRVGEDPPSDWRSAVTSR